MDDAEEAYWTKKVQATESLSGGRANQFISLDRDLPIARAVTVIVRDWTRSLG